jgi:hypothetical protein
MGDGRYCHLRRGERERERERERRKIFKLLSETFSCWQETLSPLPLPLATYKNESIFGWKNTVTPLIIMEAEEHFRSAS